jgi:hypothetical protein
VLPTWLSVAGGEVDGRVKHDNTMNTPTAASLFDMDSVTMDSPRLVAIKAADIQTHYAAHLQEDLWLAIPMHAAREKLKAYITKDRPCDTVYEITGLWGRLLDEYGLLFYGNTKRAAQDAALTFVACV